MPLAAKKETAILALLQQSTVERAAAQIGISRATLFRWLKEPEFQERLMEMRRQATEMALLNLAEPLRARDTGSSRSHGSNERES